MFCPDDTAKVIQTHARIRSIRYNHSVPTKRLVVSARRLNPLALFCYFHCPGVMCHTVTMLIMEYDLEKRE